jgi:hypothetical protein
MTQSFHIQVSTASSSTPIPIVSSKACQELGKAALGQRVIRGIEFVSNQAVVIQPLDYLNDSVKILTLEQAYYYLQGLLDGRRIELQKLE